MALQLDGRQYDSQLLELITLAGASCKSFSIAANLLQKFLGLSISAKQVSKLTTLIGKELKSTRDQRTIAWQNRLLTQPETVVEPPVQLACIQLDGGRMQTRETGVGHGVFAPHWRETKNAGFHRMATQSFKSDPHPELPTCFSSRKNMGNLLPGLQDESEFDSPDHSHKKPDFSWRPKPLFRSCLSSLTNSDEFGVMMAAEAERRGFFTARRRAFLADGLNYNWNIHRKHFSAFVPILDFIHPIERLHEVSQAIELEHEPAWEQTIGWIEDVWQGNTEQVIGILKSKQLALGLPPNDASETDARRVLAETITYLENNVERMNYPRYRREGLPVTSCLIESQIKEMNHRIKGTEKFWNDGDEAEAILQVVAAMIGDEDQLAHHFQQRPGSPYARNRQTKKH